MLYVTPEKYRTMGFGIDLTDLEDVELASILERASTLVDAYCTVPRWPAPHSFFGGSVASEQHDWTLPESALEGSRRRVWPYHWPIKAITDFRVRVTNTQYVQIAPTEIFINNASRYIEVVSLAFTGVGLFGALIPSIGLMRPVCEISYSYGWHFTASGETLYATDARTYRAQSQYWDATVTAKVYVNGVEANVNDYTIDRTEGTVTFDTQLAATDVVTADYDFNLPWEIRDGVGHIATYLLSNREVQGRGMGGLQSLKVGEVSIVTPSQRLTAADIPILVPQASWLLDGFRFMTVR